MAQLLHEDENFKILKGRNYVVIRKDKPYKFHSHFDKLDGAKTIIEMFYKGVIPQKDYFKEAMRRITTDEEFEDMREERVKPKYRNNRRR